jgi:hypothetical protein
VSNVKYDQKSSIISSGTVGLGWEFLIKNCSTEDGIEETNGFFRQNSGFSAEQKTLGIPFQTILCKRKQLGILFRGLKKEAIFQNFVPKPFAEENTQPVLIAGTGNFRF